MGLDGFIILTETDKPVLAIANDRAWMGAAVMFAQSWLIPVSLLTQPASYIKSNEWGVAVRLIEMQMHQPAGRISRETVTAASEEQRWAVHFKSG